MINQLINRPISYLNVQNVTQEYEGVMILLAHTYPYNYYTVENFHVTIFSSCRRIFPICNVFIQWFMCLIFILARIYIS